MAQLKVLTSNGQRSVMAELLPRFEQATGHKVTASYEPGQIMMRLIAEGETGDVVLLGAAALDELEAQGRIAPDTRRIFSSCGIGVAVSGGMAKPDISTLAAFKRAIIEAPAVAFTTEGASGIHFTALIEQLGIAATVHAKELRQPGGLVGELINGATRGLAIQQIPELLAVPGITFVGPLPPEVQKTTVTAGAVFTATAEPAAARALLDFLSTPEAKAVVKKMGHEPA